MKKFLENWKKKISRYHWINVSSLHAKKLNGLGFTLIAKEQHLYQGKETLSKSFPHLKQIKSFRWSIHHLTRYIPHLAQPAAALRLLLKNTDKHKTLNWSAEHETAFQTIKKLVAEITHNKHFDQNLDTRVVCDFSTYELGAALEQNTKEGW